jgi:serine/threonine-protein kinase ULK4
MDTELKKLYDGLLGDNKMHVIGYFESLIQNSEISNYLIKSYFIPLFLKLVRTYKQPILRAKICEILGLLIRHATVIEP